MTRKTLCMMAACLGMSALGSAQTPPSATAIVVTNTPQPVQIVCLGSNALEITGIEFLLGVLAAGGDAIARDNSSLQSVDRRTREAMRSVVGDVQGLKYVTLGTGFVLPQQPGSNRPPLVATNFHVAAACPLKENVRQLAAIERTGESIKYVKLEHKGRVRVLVDGKAVPDRDDPTSFKQQSILPKAICSSSGHDSLCSANDSAKSYRAKKEDEFLNLQQPADIAKSLANLGKDLQKRMEVLQWAPDIALLEAESELAAAPVVIAESSRVSELKKGQRLAFAGYPGAVRAGRAATGGAASDTALTESVFTPATFNFNFKKDNSKIQGLLRDEKVQTEMMELSGAQALPGNSGGPVFDPDTGQVVGMMAIGLIHRDAQLGLSYAVSVNDLRRFVEGTEYAIPIVAKPTPDKQIVMPPPKTESWVERLKKSPAQSHESH